MAGSLARSSGCLKVIIFTSSTGKADAGSAGLIEKGWLGVAGWVTADVPGMDPMAYSNKIPRGAQFRGGL